MALYREKDIFERRNAANEAKKALLERFKARPAEDDPAVLARKAERQAILEAREKREAEKEKLRQERLAREAVERAEREAAEEAARLAAEEAAQAEAKARKRKRTSASPGFLPTRPNARQSATHVMRRARPAAGQALSRRGRVEADWPIRLGPK